MIGLIKKYFGPKSDNPDIYRKELVLNSMLAFCLALLIIFEFLTINHEMDSHSYTGPLLFLITYLPFGASYYFSRTRRVKIASIIFIATFSVGGFYAIMMWSIFLSAAIFSVILMTILTGILINSRSAFIYALSTTIILILISFLVSKGVLAHDISWQESTPTLGDSIEFGTFILFISVVTWISNRQTELSLVRARKSEADLRIERDLLEIRVAERSRQLEQLQIEKISELYKFIEFGKLSSGLIHDLINPLNALCIEIETRPNREIQSGDIALKTSMDSLISSSRKIKEIIGATRKHIQVNFKNENFNIRDLVEETLLMHRHRLDKNHIELRVDIKANSDIFGPPTLLTHIITNLISNAIDAIEEAKVKYQSRHYKPTISINIESIDKKIILTIKDNGAGIPEDIIDHVFNPFFSTKEGRGCGYGLSASRHMAEKYFDGQLILLSKKPSQYMNQGDKINKFKTTFQLILPS